MNTAALSGRCHSSEIGAGGLWSTISIVPQSTLASTVSRRRRHRAPTCGVTEYMRALAIMGRTLYWRMALLDIEEFSCGYGEMTAVRDLSFAIEPGGVLALLGPNGAGKTSTMLAIMGHVAIKSGAVRVAGTDIAAHRRWRVPGSVSPWCRRGGGCSPISPWPRT